MKIRNGWVSNSSSANFIIKWRYAGAQEDISLWSLLCALDLEDKHHEIDAATTIDGNCYTSEFYTGMMNGYSDFNSAAGCLLMSLMTNDEYAILESVELDHDE